MDCWNRKDFFPRKADLNDRERNWPENYSHCSYLEGNLLWSKTDLDCGKNILSRYESACPDWEEKHFFTWFMRFLLAGHKLRISWVRYSIKIFSFILILKLMFLMNIYLSYDESLVEYIKWSSWTCVITFQEMEFAIFWCSIIS